MKKMKFILVQKEILVILVLLVLVLPFSNMPVVDGKKLEDGDITRDRMMEIAEGYKTYQWTPSEENVFHGICQEWQTDTPDEGYKNNPDGWWITDQENTGVPYQWGGFSSISGFNLVNHEDEDFNDQYKGEGKFTNNIHYAGDAYCDRRKPQCDNACGVDCSGFVGRCWNLSSKPSTRTLYSEKPSSEKLSWPIKFEQLRRGDILDRQGDHVMLFKEFVNQKRIRVYEASACDWKVSEREYDVIEISEDRHSMVCSGREYELFTYNPIKLGLIWLRTTQNPSGSWTYSGRITEESVGLTSIATTAFLNNGIDENDPAVRKAIDWILSKQNQEEGYITTGTYYVYDTSLATLTLVATRNDSYYDEIQSAVNFLITFQNYEDTGYPQSDKYYGGWSYYPEYHWADLSNSQFVLLALHYAESVNPDDTLVPQDTWDRATIFLTRCQNREASNPDYNFYDDGGFIYLPGGTHFAEGKSYASITTAGLWGLYTTGVSESDGRVQTARGWIENNYYVDQNYPLENKFLYYYLYGLAKACILWDIEEINGHNWYDEMSDVLVNNQETDGHWPGTDLDEEPDNVATCWALLALESKLIPAGTGLNFEIHSPADLHVYDPEERHVGINYTTGDVEIEIPGATYSGPETEPQIINISSPIAGTYIIKLVGKESGTYTYTVRGLIDTRVVSEESFTGSITPDEVHESTSIVSALAGAITVETTEPNALHALPTADYLAVENASGRAGTHVEVPVNIINLSNGPVEGIRLRIDYNESVLNITTINSSDLTMNWTRLELGEDGHTMFIGTEYYRDAIPDGSTGTVVLLNFSVIGSSGDTSPMNLSLIELSDPEGTVGTAPVKNGVFTVTDLGTIIAGRITYACNGTEIEGVVVNLTREGIVVDTTVTNESGYYTFTDVNPDCYNVNASKPRFYDNSTEVTVIAGETTIVGMTLYLKGDLNSNCNSADAGDVVLMLRASVQDIPGDERYDLNGNGVIADAGDVLLMLRASVGDIMLL